MKKDKLQVVYEDFTPQNAKDLVLFVAKPYKKQFALFMLVTLLGVVAWTASPYTISLIINNLVESPEVTSSVWWLVGAYIGFRLFDELMWRFADFYARSFKPNMEERTRVTLFNETLKRDRSFFVSASSGRIGHWINQSTSTMSEVADNMFWTVWGSSLHMIISAVFLFFAHWSLAVLFIVWLIILFWFNFKRGKRFGELVALASDERSKASGMVVDVVSNIGSTKVSNTVAQEIETLNKQQRHIVQRTRDGWWHVLITNVVKGNSSVFVSSLAVVMILVLFSRGEVELGGIVLFIAYFDAAAHNLWQLAWAFDGLYRQFGTLQNAIDGLSADEERTGPFVSKDKLPSKVALTLDGVDFAYPDQPNQSILNGISVVIEPGQKVGVVGHSGAGKSTLFGLLLGFYDATQGSIKINETDVTKKDPSFVRAVSAYVPQDTSLFNRSVKDNVSYGVPRSTDAQIKKALKLAEASEFVDQLPDGIDTLIGERGVKLSGGQRQRLAIARAILKNAPLLLLDEATSALDSVSEQAIQKALQTLMKDRTTIVIAHRLSTLKHLDRILVFEDGTIAEDGSHEELLSKKGIYADLWSRQKDGFISE